MVYVKPLRMWFCGSEEIAHSLMKPGMTLEQALASEGELVSLIKNIVKAIKEIPPEEAELS